MILKMNDIFGTSKFLVFLRKKCLSVYDTYQRDCKIILISSVKLFFHSMTRENILLFNIYWQPSLFKWKSFLKRINLLCVGYEVATKIKNERRSNEEPNLTKQHLQDTAILRLFKKIITVISKKKYFLEKKIIGPFTGRYLLLIFKGGFSNGFRTVA